MHRFVLEETRTLPLRNLRTQRGIHGGLRVLVVDDEEGFCWTLTKVLQALNYTVLSVHTVDQALGFLQRDQQIGLALMDLRLSNAEVSGDLSLLKRIKTLRPHMPVIVMSAFGTPELRREAKEHGAAGFVDKPFRVEKLLRLMREAVREPIALNREGHEFASQ